MQRKLSPLHAGRRGHREVDEPKTVVGFRGGPWSTEVPNSSYSIRQDDPPSGSNMAVTGEPLRDWEVVASTAAAAALRAAWTR